MSSEVKWTVLVGFLARRAAADAERSAAPQSLVKRNWNL
jgi:hypothetical protein